VAADLFVVQDLARFAGGGRIFAFAGQFRHSAAQSSTGCQGNGFRADVVELQSDTQRTENTPDVPSSSASHPSRPEC
jgi:hypothetical protein